MEFEGKVLEILPPVSGQSARGTWERQTVVFEQNEDGDEVAYIEVQAEDRGLAIGKEGKNIIKAKKLAFRQFDLVNVELRQEEEAEE